MKSQNKTLANPGAKGLARTMARTAAKTTVKAARKNPARLAAQRAAKSTADDTPLTEQAYLALEEMIVTLKLKPGAAVSESTLASQLGIGRTPIREALQRLAREQLVNILPRRGVIVSAIDIKAQLRLLELRREVERLIAGRCARRAGDAERAQFAKLADTFEQCSRNKDDLAFIRADRAFNELCLACVHNEFVEATMRMMNSLSRRFWYLHYKQAADLPLTAKLHGAVARAIAKADEAAAQNASDKLIGTIETFTKATLTTEF
jgi:DNA-binding GntR family transcriptional regulator